MEFSGHADMLAGTREAEGSREQDRLRSLTRELSGGNSKEALREACSDFESIFLKKMWEKMKSTVPKEGYLHNKHEDMYLSMFDQEFAKMMSREDGIGLGDMIYDQLESRLEKASRESEPELDTSVQVPGKESKGGAPAVEDKEKYFSELNSIMQGVEDPRTKADILARHIELRYGEPSGGLKPEHVPESTALDKGEYSSTLMPELNWPADGRVTSGFGWRDDPFTGEPAWHAGVDIGAEEGSDIRSCWPGKVVFSGEKGGYGKVVVVEHENGWKSFYGHNRENLVREGEYVRDGQRIATSGDTGRSTGPHVHFELRQGDQAWNPQMIRDRTLAGISVGEARG
ncbi:MAG: peptidoglycan DD-metalloendopeptidase family protein [Desulfonatronovibrionaceae bacterium]